MSNFPTTKDEFDAYKKSLESRGFTVVTKWRKGLKTIKLGAIVISTDEESK